MRKIIFYLSAVAIATITSLNSFSQKEKLPPSPPPPPKPAISVSMESAESVITVDEFYKKNPSVAKVCAGENKKIIIELKDGTKEKHDIGEEKEKKEFLSKYGALPLLPPPPPPPPAKLS